MIDETKIMQYADGTLPVEEREAVEKAIAVDPKKSKLFSTNLWVSASSFSLSLSSKSGLELI